MSKHTDKNLFIDTSIPRMYKQLLTGVASYETLGKRIIERINLAHAFRQVEQVKELASILINIPIKEYQLIAQYYLVWCKCRDLEYRTDALERIIEQSQTYKSKALTSRAAFEVYRGNTEQAFYFYTEALRAFPSVSDYIHISRAIAVLKAQEGFHGAAIKDMEKLIPIISHAEPLVYCDVLNSYAVELGEVGRMNEAENVSRLTIASPFAPYYPEWQSTYSEIRSSRKSRSTVTVSPPQKQVKPIKPVSNVLKFPTAQETTDLKTLFDLADINITPLQLLGVILKLVLRNRITDDEVDRICSTYYRAVQDMWED